MAQPVNERGVVRRHSGRLTAPLLTTMATAAAQAELYLRCIHIRLPARNLAYGEEDTVNTSFRQNIFIWYGCTSGPIEVCLGDIRLQ